MSNHRKLKVGVVGATGMVGQSFMRTMEQRRFPIAELRPFASEASLGKSIELQGKSFPIQTLRAGCFEGLDLVFFSSGDDISREWAPQAVKSGAWAVDNSNAFRMDPNTCLVVPEVNGDLLDEEETPQIIANPNCTTIQLTVALNPLLRKFGLESVHVASYQAASGGGQPAHDELHEQMAGYPAAAKNPRVFPHALVSNCIPEIGFFNADGFCSEEVKVMNETPKILRAAGLRVSAFTVRVPVLNAHAEAIWVRLGRKAARNEILAALEDQAGLIVDDGLQSGQYPTQAMASGKDPVYVGRIHADAHDPQTWLMWVVADNVRKGAALNGLQIAERIFDIPQP